VLAGVKFYSRNLQVAADPQAKACGYNFETIFNSFNSKYISP
jgi:hypothetical protein